MTMKRNRIKYAVLGVVLTGAATMAAGGPLAGPLPSAHADASCSGLLGGLSSWIAAGNRHVVHFTMVSNRSDELVSYATGYLDMHKNSLFFTSLSGSSDQRGQLFSNRYTTVFPPGSLFGWSQPFSVLNADQLGVAISLWPGAVGAVTLTLNTWGGAQVSIPSASAACANGLLYGFTSDNSHDLFSFSFSKVTLTLPPPPQ
jgi:hypothetical protein